MSNPRDKTGCLRTGASKCMETSFGTAAVSQPEKTAEAGKEILPHDMALPFPENLPLCVVTDTDPKVLGHPCFARPTVDWEVTTKGRSIHENANSRPPSVVSWRYSYDRFHILDTHPY